MRIILFLSWNLLIATTDNNHSSSWKWKKEKKKIVKFL